MDTTGAVVLMRISHRVAPAQSNNGPTRTNTGTDAGPRTSRRPRHDPRTIMQSIEGAVVGETVVAFGATVIVVKGAKALVVGASVVVAVVEIGA